MLETFSRTGSAAMIPGDAAACSSLTERPRHPSAWVILMDKLAQLEDVAWQRGNPAEPRADCRLQRE